MNPLAYEVADQGETEDEEIIKYEIENEIQEVHEEQEDFFMDFGDFEDFFI